MKTVAVAAGCVVVLVILVRLFLPTFDASARYPDHAMQLAHVRAEADAAKADASQARAELERVRAEWKKATEANEELKRRVAELEGRPTEQGK